MLLWNRFLSKKNNITKIGLIHFLTSALHTNKNHFGLLQHKFSMSIRREIYFITENKQSGLSNQEIHQEYSRMLRPILI
jgi:hypothetical protein